MAKKAKSKKAAKKSTRKAKASARSKRSARKASPRRAARRKAPRAAKRARKAAPRAAKKAKPAARKRAAPAKRAAPRKNEGEGSHSADKAYRDAATRFTDTHDTAALAERAAQEVDASPHEYDDAENEGLSHSAGDLPQDEY
jgi:hypothetical protein